MPNPKNYYIEANKQYGDVWQAVFIAMDEGLDEILVSPPPGRNIKGYVAQLNLHRRAVEEQVRNGAPWNRDIHVGLAAGGLQLRFYRVVDSGVVIHLPLGDTTPEQYLEKALGDE